MATDDKSFIFISIFLAHPFQVNADNTFRRESTDPWVGMDYSVLDSAFDASKEQENLDLAISRKFDVLNICPVDPVGTGRQIKRAREAGQIYVNFAADSLVHPTLKYGQQFYNGGWFAGQYVADNLPPGSKVYGGIGDYVVAAGFQRRQGWLDAIEDRGLVNIAFEDGTAWSQEGGYDVGRSALQRFPDIKAIFGGDDQGALGFSKAATDAGRREELLIVGVDGLKGGQDGVRDGRLDASIMWRWGHGPEAVGCMDQTLCLLRGGVHGDAVEMGHIVEPITVTKDNIEEQWQSPT